MEKAHATTKATLAPPQADEQKVEADPVTDKATAADAVAKTAAAAESTRLAALATAQDAAKRRALAVATTVAHPPEQPAPQSLLQKLGQVFEGPRSETHAPLSGFPSTFGQPNAFCPTVQRPTIQIQQHNSGEGVINEFNADGLLGQLLMDHMAQSHRSCVDYVLAQDLVDRPGHEALAMAQMLDAMLEMNIPVKSKPMEMGLRRMVGVILAQQHRNASYLTQLEYASPRAAAPKALVSVLAKRVSLETKTQGKINKTFTGDPGGKKPSGHQ